MNRNHLLIATIVLAAAATVFAQQRRAAEAPRPANDRIDLLAKIDRLEDRITKLEDEIRTLRSPRSVITVPTVPAPTQPLPPGWKEGQFNGLKYYLIPCATETTATPTTRPTLTEPVR